MIGARRPERIAVDTSALVAIAMAEVEAEPFAAMIAQNKALVGWPTLFETRLVLTRQMGPAAHDWVERIARLSTIRVVPFDELLHSAAVDALRRFRKGRDGLNFGDCLAYAVAKAHALPLLFKGNDFTRTDIVPAFRP